MEVLQNLIIAPVLVLGFTLLSLLLPCFAQNCNNIHLLTPKLEESVFSVFCVSGLFLWALLWMTLDSDKLFYGPKTSTGYCPTYTDNGQKYLFASLGCFAMMLWKFSGFSLTVYNSMPTIIFTLNVFAFLLCLYLFWTGKQQSTDRKYSSIYLFYKGVEQHPCIFGIDVKQFSIVRVGLIAWLLLTITFLHFGWQVHGKLDPGHFSHVLLQVVYICRAFYLEHGFATHMEARYDHAGYYVCWGGIVWQPVFFSWHSYLITKHYTNLSWEHSVIILLIGLMFIYFHHQTAEQKRCAKSNKSFLVWGKEAKFLLVKSVEGDSYLLLSGWWGVARKVIYLFEIALAFMWSLPAFFAGYQVASFLFVGYYIVFFVHRIARDEKKCENKYGKYWEKYCTFVPYRMIPYVY